MNGTRLGETDSTPFLRADVPVAMVAGDTAVCFEASSLLGSTLVTCPEGGLGRFPAVTRSPDDTSVLISKQSKSTASAGKSPVLKMEAPYKAELTFHTTAQTDAAALVPGSERVSGRTLVFTTDDIFEIRRWYSSSIDCASLA